MERVPGSEKTVAGQSARNSLQDLEHTPLNPPQTTRKIPPSEGIPLLVRPSDRVGQGIAKRCAMILGIKTRLPNGTGERTAFAPLIEHPTTAVRNLKL